LALSQLVVVNGGGWSLDEKLTVGGRDAAIEPTGMYLRRVCARSDSISRLSWLFHHIAGNVPLFGVGKLGPAAMPVRQSLCRLLYFSVQIACVCFLPRCTKPVTQINYPY